ncbi:signal recognition particle receptor subunit beta [Streptomonospora salina]|uniref:Signal recognition particle receptor subunit beta n=1 Tax=Streptomonospora salina TaxID=104205 RepID=A0A841EGV7_9ACTN|nr:ATP/GTP-binding protein [Streptomonospora salina]MBB6000599.1 signal recognition particle receptor subunit beta [Streptomonospora salina]
MASADSDNAAPHPGAASGPASEGHIPLAVKILVAGGFGVGKTTMVGSVSEIAPLSTEEVMTEASMGVDDLGGVEDKSTTTVALDFGRITVNQQVVLYLFGTPGQGRFWFMWDELAEGALGAVVLADTRRLDTCFPAVDFFERRRIPFVVAVNRFEGAYDYGIEEVREAVDVSPEVPILLADARDRQSSKSVLLALVEHVMHRRSPAVSGQPLT